MHKLVVTRKHGTTQIQTHVSVDHEGSPTIAMSLEDFQRIVTEEVLSWQNTIVTQVGSMATVVSKGGTEKRLNEAFKALNVERKIDALFNKVVRSMKEDTVAVAKHIR